MTGITRERASQVAADFLGGESRYLGTYYKTYAATDSQGRMWRFTYDGSIQAEKKENGPTWRTAHSVDGACASF